MIKEKAELGSAFRFMKNQLMLVQCLICLFREVIYDLPIVHLEYKQSSI